MYVRLQEEISKLLRFESSKLDPGEMMGLDDYVNRMKAGSRTIYYFCAPRYDGVWGGLLLCTQV